MHRSGSLSSLCSADEGTSALFQSFCVAGHDLASSRVLLSKLAAHGLLRDDQRLEQAVALLETKDEIAFAEFRSLVGDNQLIERALGATCSLAIPDFAAFCKDVEAMRDATEPNTAGAPASYIPQLARVDPDQYGVAVCSVDGQRYSCGDSRVPFCVQSTTKPLAYAMALEHFGEEKVHEHVGREPSGRNFNERVLNPEHRPHNPMINAGAIMTSSLVRPDLCLADRWDFVMDTWARLAGGRRPGFANSVYLSESATADRNWCLAYMMQEAEAFPEGTVLKEVLEFYFMLCSIEVDAEQMSVIAATLANGGICPLTGDRVFNARTVRNTLSLMSSCGMYDYSGEFAFQMGFPCKSGVGGSLVIVIPGVTGICTWSPSLDALGNSVRGQDFCRALCRSFAVHHLEARLLHECKRSLGRDGHDEDAADDAVALWYASAQGELARIKQLVSRGTLVNVADYDGRTALHLAAANGHPDIVEYLLNLGADRGAKDRFGATALDEAERLGHPECATFLRASATASAPGKPVAAGTPVPVGGPAEHSALERVFCHFEQGNGRAKLTDLHAALTLNGLALDDMRIAPLLEALSATPDFDRDAFVAAATSHPSPVLIDALTGKLTVPDFAALKGSMLEVFNEAKEIKTGDVPSKGYQGWRSQLDEEEAFGVSVTTVSGQRCAFGTSRQPFVAGELTSSLNYCLAQDLRGEEAVHSHIGHEPSGRGAEEMTLNDDDRPHNPFVSTGAIVSCALIHPQEPMDVRFDFMAKKYRDAAGDQPIGYCNQHFAKERRDSDRSYCLAYMMKEKGCFPEDVASSPVAETLDLYFMANSMEMNAESLSVVAATLANGGVCPTTGARVFSASAVRNCLAMMFSCGLGDFSGEFAFHVGLPGKTSTSGCTLIVVPGVLGICVWSPRLDKMGNSVRGVRFAQELVNRYSFHAFQTDSEGLTDPTVHPTAAHGTAVSALLTAASTGDLTEIRRLKAEGLPLTVGDYDARTALHLAAAEGQHRIVKYLLTQQAADGAVSLPEDRWGHTALDDARRNQHDTVIALLTAAVKPNLADCVQEEDEAEQSDESSPEDDLHRNGAATRVDIHLVNGSPRTLAQPKAADPSPCTPSAAAQRDLLSASPKPASPA